MRRLFAEISELNWKGTVDATMSRGSNPINYQLQDFKPPLSIAQSRQLDVETPTIELVTSASRTNMGEFLLKKSGTMLTATRIVRSIV